MRILFTTFCLEKAGSHIVALTLASGLAKRHESFFFNQGEQMVDQGMVDTYLSPAVKLIDMNSFPLLNKAAWKVNGLLKRLIGYTGFHEVCKTAAFVYVILRHRIELIHGHEILVAHTRLARVLRFLSVPVVITDHNGYTMLLKVGDSSFFPYANKAKAIIGVSEYTSAVLRNGSTNENSESMRVLGNKILASDHQNEYDSLTAKKASIQTETVLTVPVVTIYNGVLRYQKQLPSAESIKVGLGIPTDAMVFGMIARGTEQKGWRFALAAYQQLKQLHPKQRFAWVCMGEGVCIQEIKKELGGQSPDIIFMGNVDDPHYYMSVCDVGLVPSSFSEGLPLSIVEFFEHKVPVIASDIGGISEVIVPAGTEPGGFLIEMQEDSTPRVANLLHHMEQYVADPALRTRHGQAALAIRRRFDMDHFVESHEQLYAQVLSSSK